jgi:sec-independent protein translocase protein TatB
MFDVGFWELVLVGIVALLVVGPERLPGLARQVGFWVGRARKMIASVQSEFSAEIKRADDIQKMIKNQLEIQELHEHIELDPSKPTVPVPRKKNAEDAATDSPQKSLETPAAHVQEKEKISSRD